MLLALFIAGFVIVSIVLTYVDGPPVCREGRRHTGLPMGLVSSTSVNIFLGRRKSGKTVAIFSFLEHFKSQFKWGIVFCGSIATALEYRKTPIVS